MDKYLGDIRVFRQVKERKSMKMRVLVLCLVYASLASAGFFTPSPGKHSSKDEVVTVDNEGVVIGIEKDDGSTRVSVSPHEDESHAADGKGFAARAKDKLKEAVLPEGMKKGERVDSYVGRTKEAAGKVASGAAEKAKEAVKEAAGKPKDTVTGTAQKAADKTKGGAGEASSRAKGKVTEKAGEIKQGAKEKVREAKETVKNQGKKASKGILRRCGAALAYVASPGVLHLLGFAVAYGMSVWVTFASSYILVGALPRHQFAMVQSRMYPVYFKAMAASLGLAFLGRLMDSKRTRLLPLVGLGMMFTQFDLVAPLAMILLNLLYLEPRATKVLLERMKKEKEEGDSTTAVTAAGTEGEKAQATRAKESGAAPALRMLNSHSSLLNVGTLMLLTWHLVRLGQQLHAVC